MAKKKVYTVGHGTQYIGHSRDKRNYFPGQTFDLDHLNEAQVKDLLSKNAVADVTGISAEKISELVAGYKLFTQEEVLQRAREAADG